MRHRRGRMKDSLVGIVIVLPGDVPAGRSLFGVLGLGDLVLVGSEATGFWM